MYICMYICICIYVYMYVYIYIYIYILAGRENCRRRSLQGKVWVRPFPYLRSISEISSCFVGPRPWHIEIRHRVKKTSTINLFGFETLKLKIRRLKL